MGEDSAVYRITKLKRAENFTLWAEELKSCLILSQLWPYISGVEKEPLPPAKPDLRKEDGTERAMTKTEQTTYDAEYKQYKKDHKE